jgi:nitrite reductase/ring-hydroxylating ferredoxin subunit
VTEDEIRPEDLPPGTVRRVDDWAVGNAEGRLFAVSRRCRHQLGDLSKGSVDADGCLVCPWHQSRYDVSTGAMVEGPRGFLFWHGPTPGYTQLVLAYGRRLRLRVGRLRRRGAGLVVER